MAGAAHTSQGVKCASITPCQQRLSKFAAQWHPTKNKLKPEHATAFSNKAAHWLCPACNHTWSASIARRVVGRSCPNCHVKSNSVKYTKQPTFAACKHPLLAEWDYRRNAKAGHFPERITLSSNKQIFWLCPACPAGQEHSHSALPCTRTSCHIPSGCPYCAGHKACRCNSLRTHYPDLALQWDHGQNEGTPEDHTAHSTHMAWWKSAAGATWQQRIFRRTQSVEAARQRQNLRQACQV